MKLNKYHFIGLFVAGLLYLALYHVHRWVIWHFYGDERPMRVEDLAYLIVESHDLDALQWLMEDHPGIDCLPYAMYLADVYNEMSACGVIYSLCRDYGFGDKEHGDVYRALAVGYLEKGGKGGDSACYQTLYHLYQDGIVFPKDTAKANRYLLLYNTSKNHAGDDTIEVIQSSGYYENK